MSEPLAYLQGNFVPQSHAHLPLHDAGLIWGATVTDLCRTFKHDLYRLADHLRRFRESCRRARIPQPIGDTELADIAHRLAGHNARLVESENDLALVMFATPGEVGYYLGGSGGPGEGGPTLCMHTFPLPMQRYTGLFTEGARLRVPDVRSSPAVWVPPQIKHRSRLHWWLAEQEVHEIDPLASALLLDEAGHISETASANFIIVQKGRVLTPRRAGVLHGVSLSVIEELCRELGLPFEEVDLTPADCARAQEAMLTCTSFCLAPVARINEVRLAVPGPLFEQLLQAWSQDAGVDIREQILSSRGGPANRR